MPVLEQNIKLVKSSVMLDVEEGGGPPSSNVIVDGTSNAVFDDISELARAGGQVSLRKAHVVVQTTDTDGFYGSNIIIAKPPEDPRVHVSLFSTGQTFDYRTDAANRVEAYLFYGPEWSGYLFENHIIGQRSIQLLQRPNTSIPPVGRTMVLIMNEGLSSEYRQYVRFINVQAEERTFTEDFGGKPTDFKAWVVTCELSDTLRYDFPGSPATMFFTKKAGKTLTRDTRVTDAAKYYGVSPLKTAVALGDLKAKVKSIYTQLVPSAQTEIPLANQTLNPELSPMVASRGTTFDWSVTLIASASLSLTLPCGCFPSTFKFVAEGLTDDGTGNVIKNGAIVGTIDYAGGKVVCSSVSVTAGTYTINFQPAASVTQQTQSLFREVTQENRRYNWIETLMPIPAPGTLTFAYMAQGNWYILRDNGNGELKGEDVAYGAGTISYSTGNMSVTTGVMPDADSAVMLVWATSAHYDMRTTAEVQTPAWEYTLTKTGDYYVEKGSVHIAWTVNGVSKGLTDDGMGFLQGDGWGAISYATGQMYIRPSVLPDPGTTPYVTYRKRLLHKETFHPVMDANGFIEVTVSHPSIVPGSLSIQWETIRQKTVTEKTSKSLGGVSYFSDDSEYSSSVSMSQSDSWARPSYSGWWTCTWISGQFSGGSSSSSSFSQAQKQSISVKNSFRIFSEKESADSESNVVVQKMAFDNGAEVIYGPQAGSVDYDTGVVRFKPTDVARASSWGLTSGGSFSTDKSTASSQSTSSSWAGSNNYQQTYNGTNVVSGQAHSAGVSVSQGSSVSSSSGGSSDASTGQWGSEAFSDSWGDGSMITVIYVENSVVPVDEDETLPSKDISINLTPTTAHPIVVGSVMFRFANSLYIDRAGKLIKDPDRNGSGMEAGTINYQSGQVAITFWNAGQAPTFDLLSCLTRFGTFVITSTAFRTAASPLKSEAVQVIAVSVDGEQIVATSNDQGWFLHEKMIGKINYQTGIGVLAFGSYIKDPNYPNPDTAPWVWAALPMDASSIRYNAVAYSYLPLDASIVGLDPVRLPQDGMVPMFRKGEFAVIGNTQETPAQTVAAGTVINTGRTRLSRVRVIDANGHVQPGGYTANLDAGTVTFDDVLNYFQPVKVEHRIEDMVQVSDVQINGQLSFTRPVTHNYPIEGTYVSSALIAGDLRARVSHTFDQQTWDGTWNNSLVGNRATASFNTAVYPIVVTNAGAVTERWVVRFTNTTSFEVIGEHVGIIAYGNTSTDCAPINPVTQAPYFRIPATGWGSGWSSGNILRINTVGAQFPIWVLRAVQQGPETMQDDSFTILIRGDVDRT